MVESEKKNKLNDDLVLEKIQILFSFKIKDGEKGFKKILNELQNIGLSPIGTKRTFFDNACVLNYSLRVRELPFTHYNNYKNINKRFSKVLNDFSIQECKKLDKKIEWTGDEIREISQGHLDKLFVLFLENIDSAYLETILTNAILGSKDSTLTEEEQKNLGLVNNLEVFKKLFSKKSKIDSKELKQLFQLIDTNDFILIKQIFHLIRQKSLFSVDDLYKSYHKIKGKVPFERSLGKYIYSDEIGNDFCKLEMFFKKYIHLEGIIELVREKVKISLEDIKVQIPFEIKAYKLDKNYPKDVVNIIKRLFNTQRHVIIKVFKFVLNNELKRLKIQHDGLLVSYLFSDSTKYIEKLKSRGYYFNNLKTLYDKKLEQFRRAKKNGKIRKFIIFHGFYIANRNNIDFDWSKTFKLRDVNHKQINCRIVHNRAYFNELNLDMETEIEIQANLKVDYIYNKRQRYRYIETKYLEVIDIKIIDNFKVIKFHLGTHWNGEKFLENTKEGLSLFIYPINKKPKGDTLICKTKIMDCPLILLNVYEGQNDLFYEVKLNNDVICKPKKLLIDYLDERNLIIEDNLIKKAVSQILRESIREYNLKTKPMYNTVGIFRSKKDDLVLVYEDDEYKRIIAENDVQADLIELIKEKELDRNGILAETFYEIIHIPTLPENVRLTILGYSAIHPFFFALSHKLDLLPNLFLIGKHGSGKTTILKIFINYLFGTKMKKSDDVRTEARLTKFLTECLFALNIDDIDVIPEDQIGFIKTYSTERGTRNRMDNQKMNKEQMYASITGSANSKDFLSQNDDEAFRLRCIVHELKTNIKSKKGNKSLLRKFTSLYEKVKDSNLIFGYYLLINALKFFDKTDNFTMYQKTLRYFNKTHERIEDFFEDKGVDLSDVRRITLYTLIYIGWEIWDHTFKLKGFDSPLLKKVLDLETNIFFDYVNELESAQKNVSLDVFDSILEYFRQSDDKFKGKKSISRIEEKNNIYVLQSRFIAEYDKWAKTRGYKPLGSLTKLGELQSKLLNKDIAPKTINFKDNNKGQTKKEYGILFYFNEIYKLRNDGIDFDENLKGDFSTRINLESFIIPEEKVRKFLERIKEIFEDANYKYLERKSVSSVLEIEEELDEKFIKTSIDHLIEEELIQVNGNKIKMKK